MAYRTRYFPPLSIETNQLPTNVVVSDKIADGAVTGAKIANGSVGTPDLANGSVTSIKISDSAITSDKIAAGAVTNDKLATTPLTRPLSPPIETNEIANGAVTSDKMAAQIIDTNQLVDSAVTTIKLAPDSIDSTKLKSNAVTSGAILDGAVDEDALGTDSVSTDKIQDGAVTAAKFSGSVASRPLTPGVATVEIADGAVTGVKLDSGALADSLSTNPVFYDDFVGAALSSKWAESGDVGGSITPFEDSEIILQTGAVLDDQYRLNFNGVQSIRMNQLPLFKTRVTINLTNFRIDTGLRSASTIYAFFRYDSSVSPNWFAVTRNGGSETATDTGIAATVARVELAIEYKSVTDVEFSIGGSVVATNIANNPTAVSAAECWIETTTLENALKATLMDFVSVKYNRAA